MLRDVAQEVVAQAERSESEVARLRASLATLEAEPAKFQIKAHLGRNPQWWRRRAVSGRGGSGMGNGWGRNCGEHGQLYECGQL